MYSFVHSRLNTSAAVVFLLLARLWARADDWPTWRHDAARTAVSQESLAGDLKPQWTRKFQPIEPAWPNQPRLQFDIAYEPVVAGNTLYVASPRVGSVIALDSRTGDERWRFYSDGPIRFAPTVWNNKLYFSGDDGWLYCLNVADGTTRWKFRGGPDDRKLLGNKHMISAWPARGAPVISDGKVYFAAGIWPFMGVFLYALDAEKGQVVWSNDGAGIAYTMQPHFSPAFAGIAPQGYLAVIGEQLFVPNGRAVPARFNRSTGKLEDYRLADGWKIGGYAIAGSDHYFFNGNTLFSIETGEGTWLPSWKLSSLSFETEDRMPEPVIEGDDDVRLHGSAGGLQAGNMRCLER